jgi:MFS family permease
VRRPLTVIWGLCGAIAVGFSCILLAGIANLGLSGFVAGLLRIAPIALLIGVGVGITGSMLERGAYLTAATGGFATLLGLIATVVAGALLERSFGQAEPGLPWYTYVIGIPIGLFLGWTILWTAKVLEADRLRRRARRSPK